MTTSDAHHATYDTGQPHHRGEFYSGSRFGTAGFKLGLQHDVEDFVGRVLQQREPLIGSEFRRCAHFTPSTSGRMCSFIWSAVNGLRIYPHAPAESACTTWVSPPSVVIMTTGTPLALAMPFKRLTNSSPSITGMLMSHKIKSTVVLARSASASAPLLASLTSERSSPACRKERSTILRITEES